MGLTLKIATIVIIYGAVSFFNVDGVNHRTCTFIPCAHATNSQVAGYRIGFTAPFNKVFLDKPRNFNGKMIEKTSISMAKNEYEATQMVIFPERDVKSVSISVTDLMQKKTGSIISKKDIEINLVGYVYLKWPEVGKSRSGWHPDPLLPNHKIDLEKNVLRPVLITVKTTDKTKPGLYSGKIQIKAQGKNTKLIPFNVKVWNFELPKVSKFKSSSLLGWGKTRGPWPVKFGYNWPKWEEQKDRFLDIAELGFKNRLPPVVFLANGLRSSNWKEQGSTDYGFPTHDRSKDRSTGIISRKFNPRRTDELIDYMLSKGANHFVIAVTSDIYKYPDLAEEREKLLLEYLKDYTSHLRKRGLLDKTYVYNVDEPWGEAVVNAKKIYKLIKKEIGEDVKIMQNTNQNNGKILATFLDHFDAIDINLGFYDITKSDSYRKKHPEKFKDFWWNVNVWPRDRPNLFIEYPLVDARIIGPMSYKFNVNGFEYWDLFVSRGIIGYKPLAHDEFKIGWRINKGSLDGTLIYPADGYKVFSSLRFESLRDGIEDIEFLYLLEEHNPNHALLDVPIVQNIKQYSESQDEILNYREKIGELLNEVANRKR